MRAFPSCCLCSSYQTHNCSCPVVIVLVAYCTGPWQTSCSLRLFSLASHFREDEEERLGGRKVLKSSSASVYVRVGLFTSASAMFGPGVMLSSLSSTGLVACSLCYAQSFSFLFFFCCLIFHRLASSFLCTSQPPCLLAGHGTIPQSSNPAEEYFRCC